eukprot:m.163881 g.163881  ORF g.163881 m.163881 type:complete len:707 (-) comp31311_c0_seq3:74-2194(-)
MSEWIPAAGMTIVAEYGYSNPTSAKKSSKKFLSFEHGDRFILIKTGSKDWWLVQNELDSSVTGYVPINHFSQLQPKPVVSTPPWDAGPISREEAEARLSHPLLPDGSFLVRESKKKVGALSLSVRILGGSVKHMKVLKTHDGFSLAGVLLDPPLFSETLEDMVMFFSTTPLSRSWGTLTMSNQGIEKEAAPSLTPTRRKAPPPPSSNPTSATPTSTTTQPSPTPSPSQAPTNTNMAAVEPPLGSLLDGYRLQDTTHDTDAHHSIDNGANDGDDGNDDGDGEGVDPMKMTRVLVQAVRDNASISFNTSRIAVATVIEYLISNTTDPKFASTLLSMAQENNKSGDPSDVVGGADFERLQVIIEELTAMKNDKQQRSFSTHDDVDIIKDYLSEFSSIVEDADERVVKHLVKTFQSTGQLGDYEIVESLVVYYQMETRSDIREQVLKLFMSLGARDSEVFTVLQNGILPVELVRDMTSVSPFEPENIQRLLLSVTLSSIICALGPLPTSHYDTFNESFVSCLLCLIENDAQDEVADQIAEHATNLLLAFHLHYAGDTPALAMQCIAKNLCQKLAQRVLLLFNRQEDPVAHNLAATSARAIGASGRNSVIKFLADIYKHPAAVSNYMFHNDQNVLVEVLIREVGDRESEDELLGEYINLIAVILKSATYAEGGSFRRSDIDGVLLGLRDEVELSQNLDAIISEIFDLPTGV